MPYCQFCGNQIADEASFCPSCGKPVGQQQVSTVQTQAQVSGVGSSLLESRDIVMKKKILSLREHYDLEDRSGMKLGEGDGNFFQMPAKFVVVDSQRNEIMHINGKILSLRHEFTLVDSSGNELGKMKKKILKLIGEEYWLEQNGVELMRVYGNFTEHDYQMAINGQQVAQVHKKWIAIRDQFGISITGNVDPRLVIGATIVVEHIEVTEKEHHNSGFSFG